jgi:hypothetical protein
VVLLVLQHVTTSRWHHDDAVPLGGDPYHTTVAYDRNSSPISTDDQIVPGARGLTGDRSKPEGV